MEIKEYKKEDYYYLVEDILNNEEFKKLKDIIHHGGTNRYDHSIRVAYHVFRITKALKLNYVEATRAALLHDFFFESEPKSKKEQVKFLINHPKYALENASKYYDLSILQQDIILSHMYPFTIRIPKFLESWINNLVDNYISIYEKTYIVSKQIVASSSYLLLIAINFSKVLITIK